MGGVLTVITGGVGVGIIGESDDRRTGRLKTLLPKVLTYATDKHWEEPSGMVT